MNLLKTIIERLNQRVEVANIFDQIYPLCELNANGNEKAWVHYIGNGQAEVVTNFDAKQGTLFWAKRGKVSVVKTDSLKVSGCKTLYQTTFPLTAYAVVRKSHLPCDSEDSQDWIASRIYRLISGTDPDFKVAIGVIQYEVIPNGYINEIKSLTANYEWACVAVDVDVAVVSLSEDGCYDVCATGDIPLPDFQPCTPCLTEVAVDGLTITGNGTTADPLVAIGGGGSIVLQTDGVNNGSQSILNLKEGTNITITDDGVGGVTIDASGGGGGGVTSVTATSPLSSSGGSTPDISISQSSTSTDGYLTSTDWNTFDGKFDVPTGLSTDYLDGLGSPQPFPTIPAAQVNSDWNATSGVAEILNKPTLATGSVTSVDLTMPSAFSVSGNPVTTSGTLAVTAAGLATQYIRGDGQLATLPTGGSGGSSVSYYLNGGTAASVGTYFQMSTNAVVGANADFTRTGNGLISQFLTDVGDPNRLQIPAGNWNFEMFFSMSSNGGTPQFYVELLKYNGTTFTSIASSSAIPETISSGIVIDLYLTSLAIPATTLLVTDRLALRVYIVNNSGGRTATLHTQDSHLCQIITNFAGGVSALNGLTANTQYLAVGTSGTDFAISSASDTHTFNLPTASAANRGALSSSDFTNFAAKQDALVSGTNIKTINSTSLLGSGDITIAVPLSYKNTTTQAAVTGVTTNVKVVSQLIPANTFTVDDILQIKARLVKTGGAGGVSLRVYVNSADSLTSPAPILIITSSTAAIGQTYNGIDRNAIIKSATNTQTAQANGSIQTDAVVGNGIQTNSNINWAVDQYIIFAMQNGSAADSSALSYFQIQKQ